MVKAPELGEEHEPSARDRGDVARLASQAKRRQCRGDEDLRVGGLDASALLYGLVHDDPHRSLI